MPAREVVEVLWCGNRRGGRRRENGWAFPPRVARLLSEMTAGVRVVHLFGGLARFGVRLDIDPTVRPDVIGDAWLPPFRRDAFDVVILDPPYVAFNQQEKQSLLRAASWIARRQVVWFHTQWIASDRNLRLQRGWLVRVGDSCAIRCIQVFAVGAHKVMPQPFFERGPAIRYNRWLAPQGRLALEVR